jgi:PEP-CTERM motif
MMIAYRRLAVSIVSLVTCVSGFAWTARAESAHLTLQSQTGDFVGDGQDVSLTYTPQNSDNFIAQINESRPNGGLPDWISFIMGTVTGSNSTNTYAMLYFSTLGLNSPLTVGTYDNAQRSPFETTGNAGLWVSFQNRGLNTLVGSFTITQLTYYRNSSNQLEIGSFAVSFAQYSSSTGPGLTGTFSFQGLSVPEPSGLMMVGIGAIGLGGGYGVRRAKRRTRSPVNAA